MMRKVRVILTLTLTSLLALFLVACEVGDLDLDATPTRQPTPTWTPYATLPPLGIRAADLADRYDENAIAADLEFKGKLIDLRCDIDTIGRDSAGKALVVCHTYLLNWDSTCTFPENQVEELRYLRSGQLATFRCTCNGARGTIIEFVDCVVR